MLLENVLPATQAFSYLASKSLRAPRTVMFRHIATIVGLFLLGGAAIYIQFPRAWIQLHVTSSPFLFYPALAIFLVVKAFFVIESGGYLVHRYFEHLGFMSRRSGFFREGQKYHWTHHMIIYPLNRQYIKGTRYLDSQNYGIPWQWILPFFVVISLSIYAMGWKPETVVFVALIMGYAKLNEIVHARFHIFGHPWINSRYFQWLADVHVLHHFDQEVNFAITNPLMDLLFGTYLAPRGDFLAIKALMHSNDLNSSDFINWHYLLNEATPVEYAHEIVAVQKYPGALKKAQGMLRLLEHFTKTDFYYEEANHTKLKLREFLEKLPENVRHHLSSQDATIT